MEGRKKGRNRKETKEGKRLIRGNELWKGKKGSRDSNSGSTDGEREKCGREIRREMVVESCDKEERSASKGRPYKIQRNEE